MSEKMYPIPFKSLMNWVVEEYANCGEIFGVRKAYHATGKSLPIKSAIPLPYLHPNPQQPPPLLSIKNAPFISFSLHFPLSLSPR